MPRVIFENLSSRAVVACLFQTYANAPSGASVIAWLARTVSVNGFWRREWSPDPQLAWVQSSETSQTGAYVTADPQGKNTATLTYAASQFSFSGLRAEAPQGVLRIVQDGSVPPLRAFTGLGMARAATLLVPTQPNVPLEFSPEPHYWITVGDGYTMGNPLDPSRAAPKKELVFGADDELYVSLLLNNTLSDPIPPSAVRKARRQSVTPER
ncbi:MAG: hypothetical protein ACXW5U_00860 [Thermoanaerobaculia bacterium]